VVAPLAIISWVLMMPIKIILNLIFGKEPPEPKEANEIELKIIESKAKEPKDEILFIHGYPDDGSLWDQ
jgi:hypothetical protein